ncbi:RNA ligase [Brachyspira hampsonii]|uniref:Metallophosphoesterase n=1 Tax=Brachyspira hampsonii 30446 TaxID=1289135 RepID=A0A2U4EXI5_9SPIR|nr:RNA ligase [Brachyspira hampsonii]EKV57948.1 metallophosphoesterase [Brachyspira hampsonii 30446]MBW5389123.1 metallophosphoesterase [Brachyspira hampsonii]MBW5395441.1 metallophosphoesterase [Brachyspira hampsonii]OEJ20407.1 metallophosphoesterase [Brachyspira hampsonii]
MKVLIITVGAQGSGKSYTIKKAKLDNYSVSSDNMRILYSGIFPDGYNGIGISENDNSYIWNNLILSILENRFRLGQFTILDSTGLFNLKSITDLAKKYGYRIAAVLFDNVSLKECIDNVRKREIGSNIPKEVIENFFMRMKSFKLSGANIFKASDYGSAETALIEASKWDSFYLNKTEFEKYDNIKVIPDLHGEYDVFKKFIEKENYFQDKKIAYIFVGDLIDRGSKSKELLDYFLNNDISDNVYFTEGNHDINLNFFANDIKVTSQDFYKTTYKEIKKSFTITKQIKDDSNNIIEEKILNESELNNYKKKIRNFYKKFRLYYFFTFKGKKFFINHSGIDKMYDHIPASLLNGIITYGYKEDDNSYKSYIEVGNRFKENHNDIIQIFGHRNVLQEELEDKLCKINDNAYCIENSVEYGNDLIILNLKDLYIESYKNDREIENILDKEKTDDNLVRYKYYDTVYSTNFSDRVFYKRLWNEQTIKARGLYRYNETNEIAGRSYDKFFNYDEVNETKLKSLEKNIEFPVSVYKKYNGYLFLVFLDKTRDELIFATKSSIDTKMTSWAESLLTEENKNFIKEYCKKNNTTFVFECIHLKDSSHPIVYDESFLVLLDIIYNEENFRKLSYEELSGKEITEQFKIKEKIEILEAPKDNKYIEEMINKYTDDFSIDYEGVVFEDSKGFMVKVKCPFYIIKKALRSESMRLNRLSYSLNIHYPNQYVIFTGNKIFLKYKRENKLKEWRSLQVSEVLETYNEVLSELNNK